MSRSSTNKKQDTRQQGNVSLFDSLAAVSAVLDDMPVVTKSPANVADAFMMVDPVLTTLNRQRLDAQVHYNRLSSTFGFDDAMTEAASMQRAAIEQAYQSRLAALRRRRTESGRANALLEMGELELQGSNRAKMDLNRQRMLKQEEERLIEIAREDDQKKKDKDALWLWTAIILGLFKPANMYSRPALRL